MTTQEKSKFQGLATAYTVGVCTITADMKLVTGLHIGGGNEAYSIGGSDNPIVRDLISNLPYVPGSSLKGKMRTLLARLQDREDARHQNKEGEEVYGLLHPVELDAAELMLVFGSHDSQKYNDGKDGYKEYAPFGKQKIVPAMLSVRDAFVDKELSEKQKEKNPLLTETKFENTIDRATAVANPRNRERVPAGTVFNVELQLRLPNLNSEGIDPDKASDYLEYLVLLPLLGLALLEQDALGGGGSRGSGQVVFEGIELSSFTYLEIGELKTEERPDDLGVNMLPQAITKVLDKKTICYEKLISRLKELS